ncbi:MAG: class II fructose-bisphosphate aldolase [Pirellulales bacterium]|nr:class II fructose-bisphosphate aldolase [Pirellulales bacterium]
MLTTLKDVLGDARANRYAVPAFDCTEDVMVRAILETAEARRAPVILMCLEMDLLSNDGNGWAYQAGLIRAVADHHRIPVVLHLDHANRLELIEKAVGCGFSSVMIDGSALPFPQNVELTRAAVQLARPRGISVEGELGHVGGMDLDDKHCAENVLTEPDEVARFVELTGVDALAVSIGTSHGVYRAEPVLNIARLKQLNAVSPVPLVLHGGSGTPDAQIQDAVRHGICKLNIYADERVAMARGLRAFAQTVQRPDPLPRDMFGAVKQALAGVIAEKIDLLFAGNRARQENLQPEGDTA